MRHFLSNGVKIQNMIFYIKLTNQKFGNTFGKSLKISDYEIIKVRLRKRLENKGLNIAREELEEIGWDYLINYLEKQQKVS